MHVWPLTFCREQLTLKLEGILNIQNKIRQPKTIHIMGIKATYNRTYLLIFFVNKIAVAFDFDY